MIKFNQETIERRWMGLPDHIRNLSDNEELVHDLVGRYTHGHIATSEELLIQIIMRLHDNWDRQREAYIQYRALVPGPIVVRP